MPSQHGTASAPDRVALGRRPRPEGVVPCQRAGSRTVVPSRQASGVSGQAPVSSPRCEAPPRWAPATPSARTARLVHRSSLLALRGLTPRRRLRLPRLARAGGNDWVLPEQTGRWASSADLSGPHGARPHGGVLRTACLEQETRGVGAGGLAPALPRGRGPPCKGESRPEVVVSWPA